MGFNLLYLDEGLVHDAWDVEWVLRDVGEVALQGIEDGVDAEELEGIGQVRPIVPDFEPVTSSCSIRNSALVIMIQRESETLHFDWLRDLFLEFIYCRWPTHYDIDKEALGS